jgi:hypothetical protein
MEFPEEIRIPIRIQQGSVFNFHMNVTGPGRESKNRFFVVLNRNPKGDVLLLMLTPTTKIQKRLAFVQASHIDIRTVVHVSPKECSIFTQETAFDCNDVYEVRMQDLIRRVKENGSSHYQPLPDAILKRLITAVHLSPRVSDEIKGRM